MGRGSREAKNRNLWAKSQKALKEFLKRRGRDIVSETMRTGVPQSAQRVAETYLSYRFGGGQLHGGAGDTVLKRTLKILAHLTYE